MLIYRQLPTRLIFISIYIFYVLLYISHYNYVSGGAHTKKFTEIEANKRVEKFRKRNFVDQLKEGFSLNVAPSTKNVDHPSRNDFFKTKDTILICKIDVLHSLKVLSNSTKIYILFVFVETMFCLYVSRFQV